LKMPVYAHSQAVFSRDEIFIKGKFKFHNPQPIKNFTFADGKRKIKFSKIQKW